MNCAVCGVLIQGASALILQPPPQQVERIGADITLAIGILRHRAGDEPVLDRVEHDLVVVDADELDALVAEVAQRLCATTEGI